MKDSDKYEDDKLRCLCGLPLSVEDFGEIYPKTLREVVNYGYRKYLQDIGLITLNIIDSLYEAVEINKESMTDEEYEETISEINIMEESGMNTLGYFIAMKDIDSLNSLAKSISFFVGSEVEFDEFNNEFIVKNIDGKNKIINLSNYSNFSKAIQMQNIIEDENGQSKSFKAKDKKAELLKKKLQKLQNKVSEAKGRRDGTGEDGLDIYDIISSISSKSPSVNELEVLNMTMYQIYLKFKRLDIIEQYDLSVKSMLAGASNVKLEHWSKKI